MGSGESKAGVTVTPLVVFYGLFAAAGLVVPWYFNIRAMIEMGRLFSVSEFFAAGFETPLGSSLTSDFLIGSTPVLVWIVVEAHRLKMRYWWAYVVTTFLIAFAFACPLFLLMRECRLQAMRRAQASA